MAWRVLVSHALRAAACGPACPCAQRKAVEYMKEAITLLSEDAKLTLEDGYSWRSLEAGTDGGAGSGSGVPAKPGDRIVDLNSATVRQALAEKLEKRRRVDAVLADVLGKPAS